MAGQREQPEAEDPPGSPRVLRAAPGRQQHDRRRRHREQRGTQVVDLVLGPLGRQPEDPGQVDEREAADRHVDVEDPAPGEGVGDEAADQRPADGGDHHHGHDVAHVLAALARRDQLAEYRDRADHQPARAQSLQRAERDQLRHRLGQAGQRRPDQEDHDRGQEELLAPVRVAQLAVQRGADRRREHVGRHDPGQVRDAAEVTDDARQRGAHDQLIEHGEQDRQQQARQHDLDLALGRGSRSIARRSCRRAYRLCDCHDQAPSGGTTSARPRAASSQPTCRPASIFRKVG